MLSLLDAAARRAMGLYARRSAMRKVPSVLVQSNDGAAKDLSEVRDDVRRLQASLVALLRDTENNRQAVKAYGRACRAVGQLEAER